MNEICPRCKKRGQTWTGSSPNCAFFTGTFRSQNWNCATMNALRTIGERTAQYNEDQYASLTPLSDSCDYLVLSWYKHRGRTEGAWLLCETELVLLTLKEAERVLDLLEVNDGN